MWKILTILTVLLCVSKVRAGGPQIGDKPDLTIKTADGHSISLASLRGKIVVVDFWATWCGPCMAEAPKIAAAYQANVDKGVVFLGISLDDSASDMQKVATEKGLVWPQAIDVNGTISKLWDVHGIPHTIIIGPDGDVLWRNHPAAGLAAAIEDALKKHPPIITDPKTIADASAALDQAETALEMKDYPRAMKAMAKFPEAAAKETKVVDRLTAVRQKLDAAATERFADVDALVEKKQYPDAIAALKALMTGLPGTPTAAKAADKLQKLNSDPAVKSSLDAAAKSALAADALAAAQKLQADKKDDQAYPAFKNIVTQYAGTPEAITAADAVKKYEADKVLMARLNAASIAGKAQSLISMAAGYAQNGLFDRARKKYQEVIDTFPGTDYATQASKALAELPKN